MKGSQSGNLKTSVIRNAVSSLALSKKCEETRGQILNRPCLRKAADFGRPDSLVDDLTAKLSNFGINLKLYCSRVDSRAKFAIAFGSQATAPFGFYVGGAYGDNVSAIRKAALEAGRFGAHVALSRPLKKLSLKEFHEQELYGPDTHDSLAQSIEMLPNYEFLWVQKLHDEIPALPIPDFGNAKFTELTFPKELEGLQARVVLARHELSQLYFCGPTEEPKLNLKGLGLDSFSQVHPIPHPFG